MTHNYGFIPPKETPKLGGSCPKVLIRPDGQWDASLPKAEFQRNEYIDTYNCTAYGTENCYEILIKAKYGLDVDFSERDLGIRAGTYPPGNDPDRVAQTATRGLIPDIMLPFTADIRHVDEYYSYDSDKKGRECDSAALISRTRWYFDHAWVVLGDMSKEEQTKRMKEALTFSPLGVAVYAWQFSDGVYVRNGQDTHWCVIYGYYENGDWKCFDSYDYTTKRLHKDFGFSYVKRYHVEMRQGPTVELGVFKKFIELLKSLNILGWKKS